jgi:hypothetical protein
VKTQRRSKDQQVLHDHHIYTDGTSERPIFTDKAGRAITTNQPHAP